MRNGFCQMPTSATRAMMTHIPPLVRATGVFMKIKIENKNRKEKRKIAMRTRLSLLVRATGVFMKIKINKSHTVKIEISCIILRMQL